MKLTPVERLTLANQFRILAKIDSDEHDTTNAEILERGYEGLYDKVFEHVSDPPPEAVIKEVFEILDMYRALNKAYRNGVAKPDSHHAEFQGFDGNHDPHYGVTRFLIQRLELYEELKKRPLNSHSQMELPTYRRMHDRWRRYDKSFELNESQVREVVGSD